jgi:predicted dehydrogenase
MSERIGIGVIGLGVMGQRMLARIAEHPRSRALAAWDPDPGVLAATRARYPGLVAARTPAEVIGAAGNHCLYVASPPASHLDYANQAFDAGLAVLCEKPLTLDFEAARRSIARIAEQKLRAAVNFSLASSPGLAAMAAAVGDGSIGEPRAVEIEVAFDQWPRAWQSAAGRWLAERAEGGFTREVLSHFVFVLQRALGQATLDRSQPEYPPDGVGAERALKARLSAGGVPVAIEGRVGGGHPDFNRMTLVGSRGALEIHDWFGLRRRQEGGEWVAERSPQENRAIGQAAQLDQMVAMVEGRPHTLPGFAEALAVQETIEALLKGR